MVPTLYLWTTPNGFKPLIFREELGLSWQLVPVDLGKGEQHAPAFLQVCPNGKIPAYVDGDVKLFESGAILLHLAEQHRAFLPEAGPARARALSWLFFQMSTVGPMMGQLGHFHRSKPDDAYALERFRGEVHRIFGVLEAGLSGTDYLGGDYSIADMATYPWIAGAHYAGVDVSGHPKLAAWATRMAARPAVARAMAWKP